MRMYKKYKRLPGNTSSKYFEEIKKTIKINNKIRSKFDGLDSRESDQNVTFDDKI